MRARRWDRNLRRVHAGTSRRSTSAPASLESAIDSVRASRKRVRILQTVALEFEAAASARCWSRPPRPAAAANPPWIRHTESARHMPPVARAMRRSGPQAGGLTVDASTHQAGPQPVRSCCCCRGATGRPSRCNDPHRYRRHVCEDSRSRMETVRNNRRSSSGSSRAWRACRLICERMQQSENRRYADHRLARPKSSGRTIAGPLRFARDRPLSTSRGVDARR